MKRKIFSILFALVLVCSFSLVTAVPVAAVDPSSTFSVTDGTYTTTRVDDENGDISATLTGAWGDSAVIGDFTATGTGGLYVVMEEPRWGTTATISVSGTLSEVGITFSGTAVRTEGDPITDDEVTGIAGTLTIEPDGVFVAALTGDIAGGYTVDIDISGSMVRPVINASTAVSFLTIQAAIDAAQPYDTIVVAAGIYDEQVVIGKSLILQGAGKDVVTVTGTVTIKSSDVVVDGFRIEGTVYVNDSISAITDAVISNNYITGGSYGVMVGTSSENIISQLAIEYNEIIGNASKGICFWKVDWQAGNLHDVTIRGNTISSNEDTGISTYGAGPYIIINNIVSGNAGNGISIKYDDGDVITGNIVENNTAMGINMHQVTNCVVEDNTVSGHVSEEVFTTFWGGSDFVGKGSGIYLHEVSTGNTIRYNNLSGNFNGVLIGDEDEDGSPSDNSINYNNITGNLDYGVLNALVEPPAPVDATNNWWGAANGPSGPLALGGDWVSVNVDFRPWYATETTTPERQYVTVKDGDTDDVRAYSDTIQGGVDAANPAGGDTIEVAAGTYNENIVVNKTLTLEGSRVGVNARGRTGPESIINAQGVPIAVLINGAETVATFDGFTVENYDTIGILGGAFRDTLQGVTLGDDPVAVHILNNIVMPPTVAPPHNNNIQVGDGTTGTIIGNEVSGAFLESGDWSGSGIIVAGSSNVVVSNNHADDCEGGIQILGYAEYRGGPAAVSNLIENNLVENCDTGISVQGNSIGTIVRYNDVLNNDTGIGSLAYDISWDHSTPSGTEVHYNNIVGNENYGVASSVWWHDTGNVPAEVVDATNNWWDSASGPADAARFTESGYEAYGNAVSTNVDYEPWLLEEQETATAYDRTLALKDGWTLISVDKAVAEPIWVGTNPLVVELPDETMAYKYTYQIVDDVLTGGFVPATTTDLEPLTAIYVLTNGGGGVGINYAADGDPAFYSKELEAGWNLISIPSTVADTDDILSSLRYVTIGTQQGIGLTTLVSQGDYNQFSIDFYEATLTDAHWSALPDLDPFDGYWANMEAAEIFEVPIP